MYEYIDKELKNYSSINKQIQTLEKQLTRVEGFPKDISAVDFSKVGSGGGGQLDAFRQLQEVQKTISQLNKLKLKQKQIEEIIKIIEDENELEYKFIKYYYIDGMKQEDVLNKLYYSEASRNTIYNIKYKVLEHLDQYWIVE